MSFLIAGARLIDGTGAEPLSDAAVLVEDGRIAAVGPTDEVPRPPEATVIAGDGCTVMPGLIDVHVHLRTPAVADRLAYEVRTSSTLKAFYMADNARRTLEAGFTTLRDVGSGAECLAVRDAIDRGLVPGPRVLVAGMVSMTAGHSDPAMGMPNRTMRPEDADQNPTADGVDEVRKRVREHVRSGYDWIKICTSGGVLSAGDESWWRNYTLDEIRAITDEAHALGRRVASHAHGREGIANAILGGVDTIEHGIYLDDEILEMMLERDLYLVPTLTIGRAFQERAPASGLSEEAVRKGNAAMEVVMTNMARAHEAGVRMALGTDCSGNLARAGENAWELPLMVEIGMTPMEALVSGTGRAAQAIGVEDVTGTLEVGKAADLLLVRGNPLDDIGLLRCQENILLVIKDGEVAVEREREDDGMQDD